MHFTQRSKDIRSIAPIAREWRPDTVFLENDVVMTDDDRLWVCLSRREWFLIDLGYRADHSLLIDTSNVRNMVSERTNHTE